MLVTIPQIMTITEMFQLERFGEIKLFQGNRPVQFTQENVPNSINYDAYLKSLAKKTILLDDGMNKQNQHPIRFPDGRLETNDAFRMGNTVQNITGIVNYSKGSGSNGNENYRIIPVVDPVFNPVNTRLEAPATVGGTLKIASLNVLNYFMTINSANNTTANGSTPRGANNITEFNRQREKLITTLKQLDADVLGLVEIENDFNVNSSKNAIQDIVNGLNTALGSITYDWVKPNVAYVGGDAIAVGVIYKTNKVKIAPGTNVKILDDSQLVSLGLPNSPAIFNGEGTNRTPLAVTFMQIENNEKFTIIVNHLKSKGSAGAAGTLDNNLNDGAGNSNQTRLNGVNAIQKWITTDPTSSNDPDFILVGDFNAYAQEEPIKYLESKEYTDLARNFMGNSSYSYVFDGLIGTLDYAFASKSLLPQITAATHWHINADEATAIDYNLDFNRLPIIFDSTKPYRVSDHDPVVVGLNLNANTLNNSSYNTLESSVKVYPLPLGKFEELKIEGNNMKGEIKLSIYNTIGKKLIEQKTSINNDFFLTINVQNLDNGIYFLIIENNRKKMHKKIVK